jgi:formylglycine-generating enzyme required for sulfatase activity
MIRGGSWRSDAKYARVPLRNNYAPAYCYYSLGFRLASSSK